MIVIHEPGIDDLHMLQQAQGCYYWSRLAAELLRAHGLISVRQFRPRERADKILQSGSASAMGKIVNLFLRETRGIAANTESAAQIYEAPLHPNTADLLGIKPCERITIDEVAIFAMDGVKVGVLQRRRFRIRTAANEIHTHIPDDPYWRSNSIQIEIWSENMGEVLAWMELPNGQRLPAVLRKNQALVFAMPLFDVAGSWLAFPELNQRYAGIQGTPPFSVFSFCLALIEQHLSILGNCPLIFARKFPEPFTWALSMRHHYDRQIEDASWRELFKVHARHGIKASIGILDYLMPPHVLKMIEEEGHEVQLHCFAQTEFELRNHASTLSQAIQQPLEGVTIHGGPSGVGFRGDTHIKYFEAAGLSIAENYGVRTLFPAPLARIVDSAPEATARLVASPFHYSLDGSTRIGDHRIDRLIKEIPAAAREGDYIVLMNHPDIHRDALCILLDALDYSKCWRPTIRDAMRFARSTRTGARIVDGAQGRRIAISEPLGEDAVFDIRIGGLQTHRIIIAAGEIEGELGPESLMRPRNT